MVWPPEANSELNLPAPQADIGQRAVSELLQRADVAPDLQLGAQLARQLDAPENKSAKPCREFTRRAPQQCVNDQAALAAHSALQFISRRPR